MTRLPRLYPILDAEVLARAAITVEDAAAALREAGVAGVQYRDKRGTDTEVVACMQRLRVQFPRGKAMLILNDRVHLFKASGADGVHVGQQDMAVKRARRLLGRQACLGVSTHNMAQVRAAAASGAPDYIAIGPVFATSSKQNPDPVVGLEGVAAARELTRLPLVAIGGIDMENARSVLEAGADAVAVISVLLPGPGQSMVERVRDILELFR